MSIINEPIRNLLKSENIFFWENHKKTRSGLLRTFLSKEPVLIFFNLIKPLCVSVDASKCGLGAVLIQEKKVACTSRTLTQTEKRYAQTEKTVSFYFWSRKFPSIYLWSRCDS